jgi:hypothetical protein
VLNRGAGQCQLTLIPGHPDLLLRPMRGNQLWINGRLRLVPDAGIFLSTAGLSPGVTYYIYAAWPTNAMVLEASTTGYEIFGGLFYKSGDGSRTLVGIAHTITQEGTGNTVWVDLPAYRLVLSAFNQPGREAAAHFTAPRSITSTVEVEVHDEIRAYFLAWSYSSVELSVEGTAVANAALAFDSLIALDDVAVGGVAITTAANQYVNIAASVTKTVSETMHYITLHGFVQSPGTVTWHGDSADIVGCRTHVVIL